MGYFISNIVLLSRWNSYNQSSWLEQPINFYSVLILNWKKNVSPTFLHHMMLQLTWFWLVCTIVHVYMLSQHNQSPTPHISSSMCDWHNTQRCYIQPSDTVYTVIMNNILLGIVSRFACTLILFVIIIHNYSLGEILTKL